ncbi:hypothetical protein VTG60DRAFT_3172 [Thermothelomyces hinnuleus]
MDRHDPIDLEGLPSDAFDTEDFDDDQPQTVSDRSSSPAESSPVPSDDNEVEYSDPELDEIGGVGDEADHDSQEDDYFEVQGEDEDDTDGELSSFDLENDDAYDLVLDGEAALDELWAESARNWGFGGDSEREISDERPSASPSAGHRFAGLLAEIHARRDAEGDSLFVDRGPNILPPLEELISNVRRNHARALGLASELHSHLFGGQERTSRGLLGGATAGPSRESHRQNHRQSSHRTPQGPSRERARMNDNRHRGLRDELIEVEVQPARASLRRSRSPPRRQPEVIDLTGEPDSPELPRAVVPPRGARASNAPAAGRNPRRHASLNQRTPSLSRTDSSILGNQTNVIDLTLDDSPAPPPLPQQLPRRNNPDNSPHHRHHHHNHQHRHRHSARAQASDLDNPGGFGARFAGIFRNLDIIHRFGFGRQPEVEVQFIGGRGLNMDNPLGANIPNLDYRVSGSHSGSTPKPDHVPPPPAREGFTRDTGNPDDVIICPSCEQELKYDPDAGNESGVRPAKKPRTRKDQEEHHFWALKDCGHVYCKDCYENRRVGSKNSSVRFRRDPENSRKNLCAVEGCTSEANNKSSWVGLFV